METCYDKILKENYVENATYGILNSLFNEVNDAIKIIDSTFSDFLMVLEKDKCSEDILDYVFDNFNISRTTSKSYNEYGMRKVPSNVISGPLLIEPGSKYSSNALVVVSVGILKDLISINSLVLFLTDDKLACYFELSAAIRELRHKLIFASGLLTKKIKHINNCSNRGKANAPLQGLIIAICWYLKKRPNATSGEIWNYFSQYYRSETRGESSNPFKIEEYEIYVDKDEMKIYQRKIFKKGRKKIIESEGTQKENFINKYVRRAKNLQT